MIGDVRDTLLTELVNVKVPLLIGMNSLEKLKATLDYGKKVARLFGQEVQIQKVHLGHFCIDLSKEDMSSYMKRRKKLLEVGYYC